MYESSECFFQAVPERKLSFEHPNNFEDKSFNKNFSDRKSVKFPNKLFHKNLKNSTSVSILVNIKCYEREKEKYGEHRNYSISFDENKNVKLVPNHRPLPKLLANGEFAPIESLMPIDPINNSKYIFIIMNDKNNQLQLRISMAGSHTYLANQAEAVFAAGEIYFAHNKITFISDQSGAYMVNADHPEFNAYRKSFKRALKSCNLPVDREIFHPVIEKQGENLEKPCAGIGMASR